MMTEGGWGDGKSMESIFGHLLLSRDALDAVDIPRLTPSKIISFPSPSRYQMQ